MMSHQNLTSAYALDHREGFGQTAERKAVCSCEDRINAAGNWTVIVGRRNRLEAYLRQ